MLLKIYPAVRQRDMFSPIFLSATPSVFTFLLSPIPWWICMAARWPGRMLGWRNSTQSVCITLVLPSSSAFFARWFSSLIFFRGHVRSTESRQRPRGHIARRVKHKMDTVQTRNRNRMNQTGRFPTSLFYLHRPFIVMDDKIIFISSIAQ